MGSNIFENDEPRFDFTNDPINVRPKVSRIALAKAQAGETEWLTWVSGRDAIHLSAPRATVEGFKVVPDRSLIQGRVFHPRHDRGRGVAFPFNVTNSSTADAEVSEGELHGEVESAASGTETDFGK